MHRAHCRRIGAPAQLKPWGGSCARDFIVELTRFVAVANTEAVRYAAALPMTDFEDALQVAMCQG